MELHFNVSGADRKRLVETISKELNIKAKYLGVPSCAYQVGDYTINKDGTMTFDESIGIAESSQIIDACVMAGFEPEDWERNVEPEVEEQATELTDLSLTIEMPRADFSDSQLENLQRLIDAKAQLLKEALAIDNLPIIVTEEKVSFPWFKDDIDADACAAYTCLITAICRMAKDAKRVTAKEKEVDNTKYAFRCFLLRLGFIGDEYKQNRKILMKNLKGSAAFKSGAKKGGEENVLS